MLDTPMIAVPIRTDENGQMRVGNTRIMLELVIFAYQQGETPEGIVDIYSSLKLSDVYAVIGYYLDHQAEIDAYIALSQQKSEQIAQEIMANYTPSQQALHQRLHNIQHKRT